MKSIVVFSTLSIAAMVCAIRSSADACDSCGAPVACQTYRLVCQTVYDERQVTAFRIDRETVYEDRRVTSYRPVVETQLRERRYTVAKPIYETAEREERYTVMKPVYETQIQDCSYNRVRDVMETSEREERYIVNRPVYETSEREDRYIVRKPVMETAERDQYSTVCEPQTTYCTRYADRGGWQEYQVCKPGPIFNQSFCVPSSCTVDPCTGLSTYIPARMGVQQVQGPSTMEVNRVWRPNIVAEQIPQTTYVQKVVVQKVPVQVCRYVDQEVVQKTPVTRLPSGARRASAQGAGNCLPSGHRTRRK